LTIALAQFRFFEIFSHLYGSLWGTGYTRSSDTAVRVGDRNQEISSGLPIRRLISEGRARGSSSNLQFANMYSPHINEILPSLSSRSEICHLALMDEADFVKMVVKLLASLVDGDNGSQVEGIGCYPKRLNKLQSSGCIQTTSGTNQKILVSNLVFNLKI